MARLRAEFEALGFADVTTFIASGNVRFTAPSRPARLESHIEAHLTEQLGFPAPTFIRERRAVARAATLAPFPHVADTDTHLVAFLRRAPSPSAARAALALGNDRDQFATDGKDLHWLIHGAVMDSSVKTSLLSRTLGHPFTTRNVNSLRKFVATMGT
jgi:uncharacterized protein (DUF1697 family)